VGAVQLGVVVVESVTATEDPSEASSTVVTSVAPTAAVMDRERAPDVTV
jgi:hypothetical protein